MKNNYKVEHLGGGNERKRHREEVKRMRMSMIEARGGSGMWIFLEVYSILMGWFKGEISQVCIIRFTLGSPAVAALLAQCSLPHLLFCLCAG